MTDKLEALGGILGLLDILVDILRREGGDPVRYGLR
jgi:hypothetical protein